MKLLCKRLKAGKLEYKEHSDKCHKAKHALYPNAGVLKDGASKVD